MYAIENLTSQTVTLTGLSHYMYFKCFRAVIYAVYNRTSLLWSWRDQIMYIYFDLSRFTVTFPPPMLFFFFYHGTQILKGMCKCNECCCTLKLIFQYFRNCIS